ncbi:MAG: hypothetical protein AAGU21_12845 [Solidesulfovibrio sp.]|uniref:hypothetical protein n=1 Tax=Solidesulfovibrio sp. TaxID=2910990 RepID=UPI00315974B2
MQEDKKNDSIDLEYKQTSSTETSVKRDHGDVGPSSLCGRVGDNITFHVPGCSVHGMRERLWSWAWKDLFRAFFSFFRLFFSREK